MLTVGEIFSLKVAKERRYINMQIEGGVGYDINK